ncbi:MAG: ABC transporter substrate-binding protein [Chloroflexi bacterium AL-W]|nr:ABC transporter substrate-binding protein [Chloroflexi bacterium AL-N1]NOK70756.1 ABC transporter substrate-binding protein [Chloroflexi bacterium AL-N10]NOK78316.1 ABC transporter substrate-binding protein [Chloroflexi bacterium AL-N5]NOK85659.1 ABC transporter substrate-binding protein [Chloroflexi bacterium AL-W]NOK92573.1 ABC transporter substrate-binding protein [Chloroflexi bacterium AL-N15]
MNKEYRMNIKGQTSIKRTLYYVTHLIVLLFLLAACGGTVTEEAGGAGTDPATEEQSAAETNETDASVGENETDTSAEDVEADANNTTDFPVTIDHTFGSTTISEVPERVVTIGYSEQDPVLALGVVPVAIRDWFGDQPSAVWPWAQDQLGGAEPEVLQMDFGQLNFEVIAALQPDLLIATHSGITEEEYETLSEIAPVVAQSGDYPDFGMPWQKQTRVIGQALGRAEQAEELVAEVEARIDEARQANPVFETSTVAWTFPADDAGQLWVVGPNTLPVRFLQSLGLQYPDDVADFVGEQDSAQISGERLELLDVDVLILQASTDAERDALESNPLYNQLAVVQDGRTVFFVGQDDPLYGALSFSTVLSLSFAIEELVPLWLMLRALLPNIGFRGILHSLGDATKQRFISWEIQE